MRTESGAVNPKIVRTRKRVGLFALSVALLGGLAWLLMPAPDPLFHGKRESEWIKAVDYSRGDEQSKQWKDFGQGGVHVLIRALDRANGDRRSHWERIYLRLHEATKSQMPVFLLRWLPRMSWDSTYITRLSLIQLLSQLGNESKSATPSMTRALSDGASGVRMVAISFFTWSEDQNSRLKHLSQQEKQALLPEFIRLAQDPGFGVRNNAVIALRYFPEQSRSVAPVLEKVMHDPSLQVRICAAESLYRVAPDRIRNVDLVSVVIAILKDPDRWGAVRAAGLLGEMRAEPALDVPALIEALQDTDDLVASSAARALANFRNQADQIIPALKRTARRKDNVGDWANDSLRQLELETTPDPGGQK